MTVFRYHTINMTVVEGFAKPGGFVIVQVRGKLKLERIYNKKEFRFHDKDEMWQNHGSEKPSSHQINTKHRNK